MPKSPLEQSFSSNGKKSFSKPLLIIALLATLGLGGGVLAANINVNSGNAIEFGQGTVATIACDTDVTLVPTSTYESSTFILSSVEIRNIDQRQGTNAGNDGCNGKTLTVKVLNSSGTVLSSIATVVPSATAASATITVTPTPTASATATAVARLTLESN